VENPTIAFGLTYAGELIFCEVVMHEHHYELFFDGEPKGTIEHDDNWQWIQVSGSLLSLGVIKEIGFRIESYYQ